jgi:GNAT superfamily N-acetyltransferase
LEKVEIRRPRINETEELHQFFQTVITDTFEKEGLMDYVDDINEEIITKINYLKSDFDSNGATRYHLIAVVDNKIIGTIEYGAASDLIITCSNGTMKGLVEVGTVFVHPDYQRQGVGNILLNEMVLILQSRGIREFCLDSGYRNAQKVWKKKFGQPLYCLKDYWSKGNDHMIWKINIEEK